MDDDPDRAVRAWLRMRAREHAGWGYRPAYVGARIDGWVVNQKNSRVYGLGNASGWP